MQPSQEKLIVEFMSLTECQDEQKALQYLQMSNNNLENAAQLYFDLEGYQPNLKSQSSFSSQQSQQQQYQNQNQQISQQDVKDVNTMIFNQNNPPPELIRQQSAPDVDLVEKYKKYQQNKRANDDGILKKTLKLGLNALKYIFKRGPNHGIDFQRYLQQQQIQTTINFQMGNFSDNLKNAYEEIKPLLVYIHNQESLLIFQKMISCQTLVQMLNKHYRIVGFLENPQVYEQLPLKPQPPTFLIFRLDLTEQNVLMDTINLTFETNYEDLAGKLKLLKGQFNKQLILEDQAKNQVDVQLQYLPNYNGQQYQRQQQQNERRQLDKQQRERELLIQQQQEAYRIAEQQVQEKRRKEQELMQNEQNKLFEQQQLSEQRLLQKATMLSNLPDEPQGEDGIEILFRFLNAKRTRRFNLNDKIQSIFDFVQSQEDDCFNDPNSNIDLIQNFPRLALKDKKELTISDVFTDSNMVQLIVEEYE
ncbi:unnamed protein product [Paramecium sonneborni]|uniref:UBX domain-containing protein n=1 Tax=Paramecium sonneborni TaxID=65129 RepID=A0A8S1JZG3_9CILI|nr:unnamed protein product [Paramecium sonneborni]